MSFIDHCALRTPYMQYNFIGPSAAISDLKQFFLLHQKTEIQYKPLLTRIYNNHLYLYIKIRKITIFSLWTYWVTRFSFRPYLITKRNFYDALFLIKSEEIAEKLNMTPEEKKSKLEHNIWLNHDMFTSTK